MQAITMQAITACLLGSTGPAAPAAPPPKPGLAGVVAAGAALAAGAGIGEPFKIIRGWLIVRVDIRWDLSQEMSSKWDGYVATSIR
jgi:hypothetical protein